MMFKELRNSIKIIGQYEQERDNPLEGVEGQSYNEQCYHGSCITRPREFFKEFDLLYGDRPAIWMTPEEDAAEAFVAHQGIPPEGRVDLVYTCYPNLNNALYLDMSYRHLSREIVEYYYPEDSDYYDLIDCIDNLYKEGFDGWVTIGSIPFVGNYTDVAVFDPSTPSITGVKLRIPTEIEGWTAYPPLEWTPYLDLDEAYTYIEEFYNVSRPQN